MYVVKADGTRQEFRRQKIVETCLRSGLSRALSEKIGKDVEKKLFDGISTHEIYRILQKELDARSERSSYLLRLREAISMLDPASFEVYTKKLLDNQGYRTSLNVLIKGKCVEHEVDVVASRSSETALVECKHHKNLHRFTGLGTCLQVEARMQDINAKRKTFSVSWIVTNNKFSGHAIQYAGGMGIRLTGWRSGGNYSLEKLSNQCGLFPVTILRCDEDEIKSLLEKRIVTLQDVIDHGNPKSKSYPEASRILSFKFAPRK